MSQDQIIIKLGMDTSSVSRGLRTVTGQLRGFAGNIKKFLGPTALLGGLLSVDPILDGIRDKFGNLKNSFAEFGAAMGGFFSGSGSISERWQRATVAVGQMNSEIAQQISLGQKARAANKARWAEEKRLAEEAAASAERRGKIIEETSKLIQERLDGELTRKAAVAQTERELADTREEAEKLLKAGVDGEKYAQKKLQVEQLLKKLGEQKADLAEFQLSIEQQITTEKQKQTFVQKQLADLGKLTLQELANSTSGRLAGDRVKARQALALQSQAEQARLSGDEEGFKRLTGQADKIISGDRASLTWADIQKVEDAERFKGTSLEGYFNSRAADARSRMEGIGSLKNSEKESPFQQATEELKTIRSEIQGLKEKLTKE